MEYPDRHHKPTAMERSLVAAGVWWEGKMSYEFRISFGVMTSSVTRL